MLCNGCTPQIPTKPFDLRYRAGATLGLVGMDVECLRSNRYFDNDSRARFEESYLLYRSAASKLGHAAIEQKKARWRQRPKSHALEHGVYDFNSKNLKYLANWLDEDFIRRTKRLAIVSSPIYVSRHVLFRWSIAASLRWTGMCPE